MGMILLGQAVSYIKDSLYEELGSEFDRFSRYNMKSLLVVFNAKVGREDIFKPTIGNESSYKFLMTTMLK
jgi:hypothetical protein